MLARASRRRARAARRRRARDLRAAAARAHRRTRRARAIGAKFPDEFPTVFGFCKRPASIRASQNIPVAPAAHYHMGGIAVDEWGRAIARLVGVRRNQRDRRPRREPPSEQLAARSVRLRFARRNRHRERAVTRAPAGRIAPHAPALAAGCRRRPQAIARSAQRDVRERRPGAPRVRAARSAFAHRGARTTDSRARRRTAQPARRRPAGRRSGARAHTRAAAATIAATIPERDEALAKRSFTRLAASPELGPARMVRAARPRGAARRSRARRRHHDRRDRRSAAPRARAHRRARRPASSPASTVALLAFRLLDDRRRRRTFASPTAIASTRGTVATIDGPARARFSPANAPCSICSAALAASQRRRARSSMPSRERARRSLIRARRRPGLRALEKYAVRCGGGSNHRFGLDDAVLIKDNHLALAGSIRDAVARVRERVGHMVKVEVEVDTLEHLREALEEPIDAVLLDNMAPAHVTRSRAHRRRTRADRGKRRRTLRDDCRDRAHRRRPDLASAG